MVTAMTRVLWLSCDIILPIAIMELLRVLLEPTLLVTSSLRLVWIIAGSSAVIAGSSGSIVSSIPTIVVTSSWPLEPGALQIYALSQGMTASTVLGMFRAWNPQDLLCAWSTALVSTRIIVLASDPSICVSH